MRILEFMKTFPDENSCKEHFRSKREQEGIRCKKCNCMRHYWLESKWQWQCSECNFRTTLRSGTIMEDSKMPFTAWYMAMALMTFAKKGISAKEVQRQMGRNHYHSVWSLMHKIRDAMGKRDSKYLLEDIVEFDEAYFTQPTKKGTQLKRGKGSQKQVNVAVMAESTPLEELTTNKKSTACRYFKMKVLDDHTADKINETIKTCLDEKCIVFSDKSKSYLDIADLIEAHVMEKSSNELTNGALKWVHIAITNAKTNFSGTYHKIKAKYLQRYLDEFCYKLNRRYFGTNIFDRLTIAVAMNYW
jgi:ISXO2-like transposase domain